MSRLGQRRVAGFTLLELLLAITLMSMLLAMAYGGLRAATRAADRGQDQLQQSGHLRAAHQFVRRQLAHILPLAYTVADQGNGPRVVFEGDASAIQFVATMPGYLGYGGPQVQRIALQPHGETNALFFSHAPLQGYEEGPAWQGDPVLLLEDVADAAFAFQDRDVEGELTGWAGDWPDSDRLPVAISLDVVMADGSRVGWPLLLSQARIDPTALGRGRAAEETYQDAMQRLIRGRQQGRGRNEDD